MTFLEAVTQLPARQRPGAMAVIFMLEHGGEAAVSELEMATRLPRQQLRTILQKLEEAGILTRNQPDNNQKLTKISLTPTRSSRKNQPQTNHKLTKNQPTYNPSKEAKKAAEIWDKKRMLPKSDWMEYWKIFDDMQKLDGLQWNGEGGIWAIVEHATTAWESHHIQTPTKLRQKSRTYPELKTWEVIRNQMKRENAGGEYRPRRPSLSK